MYRVMFEGSKDEQRFLFNNYDDAFNFASMAVDNGTFQDYELIKKEDGSYERSYYEPAPIKVTVVGVDE